ncbi:ATPase 7, plasma membrane-type [Phytophthora ramorum]|uniref:ATPase 7, plasma membrane-type n=1 Tax=Phytophthora ramorum TaxID=164328 RepID=UPI0030AEB1B3|nr:ATPase 7, plasma membrane-type [Phytophthora ramorum]
MTSRTSQKLCVVEADGFLGMAKILVIIVDDIPVAMPTVLFVTLVIDSSAIAKENAIMTRAVRTRCGMSTRCCTTPTTKRTIAKLKDNKTGEIFRAVKNDLQVVLAMVVNADAMRVEVEDRINKFVSRGYRGLGVGIARSGDVPVKECEWQMIGLLPLFDLPRHDTADTVKKAIALVIAVKMVTGDQKRTPGSGLAQMIYDTDGFALVFPEHKFEIVKHLQSMDKVVGMTGDGVNDAPALAQVDIGIAVDDATDAARAATDIVLVPPDLSVIITTIRMSREIFLRMKPCASCSRSAS